MAKGTIKSTIISELANNKISLELAFNKLYLVASIINNKELLRWVEHEISGYYENDVLPTYRKSEKSMQFVYSGLNGTYPINNAPMPFTYFPDDIQEEVVNFRIYEAVKIIEKHLGQKEQDWTLHRDCTQYANGVFLKTGIQCHNISQVIQRSHYEKTYNTIKFILTKVLMLIEKWFGTLDTLELKSKKYEKQRLFEASREISSYIAGLFDLGKGGIPNPRISIPNARPQHSDPAQLKQQQPAVQNMAPQPQQQPMMQQPIMPPPQPVMQQPIMPPPMMQQPMMPPPIMQQPIMPPPQPVMQQPIMPPPIMQQPIMPPPPQSVMQQPIMSPPMMQQTVPVEEVLQEPVGQVVQEEEVLAKDPKYADVIITPPPQALAIISDEKNELAMIKDDELNKTGEKNENIEKTNETLEASKEKVEEKKEKIEDNTEEKSENADENKENS